MNKRVLVSMMLAALLTGCGTMNSNFSCNATAGDSCLTIEQVDAMTRFADDVNHHRRTVKAKRGDLSHSGGQVNSQNLWVANSVGEKSWA